MPDEITFHLVTLQLDAACERGHPLPRRLFVEFPQDPGWHTLATDAVPAPPCI